MGGGELYCDTCGLAPVVSSNGMVSSQPTGITGGGRGSGSGAEQFALLAGLVALVDLAPFRVRAAFALAVREQHLDPFGVGAQLRHAPRARRGATGWARAWSRCRRCRAPTRVPR